MAEYALRGVAKPMGVAEYQFMREVPESLETDLPTIDQIEAELRPDLPDSGTPGSFSAPSLDQPPGNRRLPGHKVVRGQPQRLVRSPPVIFFLQLRRCGCDRFQML